MGYGPWPFKALEGVQCGEGDGGVEVLTVEGVRDAGLARGGDGVGVTVFKRDGRSKHANVQRTARSASRCLHGRHSTGQRCQGRAGGGDR